MAEASSMKAEDFAPLHCHSFLSILDGLNSPEDMVARAAELGHKSLALTDHGSCAGLYRFVEACKVPQRCKACGHYFAEKAGECPKCKAKPGEIEKLPPIKPILGMEGYVVSDPSAHDKDEVKRHVTLWAKNKEGYQNLIWLSTFGSTNGFYEKPRISLSLMNEHKNGLVVGTACVAGMLGRDLLDDKVDAAEAVLGSMKEMFGEDLYVEFMNHTYFEDRRDWQTSSLESMKKALALADRLGVKSVFTYDSHYCRPSDAKCQDVLLAVQTGNTIKNPKRMTFGSGDFYMKPIEEIVERCLGRMDLVTNTREVSEKIEPGVMPKYKFQNLLPPFPLPLEIKTEEQYLKTLIRDGMLQRGVYYKPEYRARITYELEAIVKLGFVRYFLVLWDAVNYAKRSGIRVGAGRGSAAGSLCIYCLGITQLDPLQYGLYFERFINPERVSPPDVDVDYADDRQEDMFRYVSDKYNRDKVARIGTYNTIGAKDALKRVGKALDVGGDWEDAPSDKSSWKSGPKTLRLLDAITKVIDEKPGTKLKSIVASNQEIKGYAIEYPELFQIAQQMEGTVTSAGKHAAGVVLCIKPLAEIIPIRLDKDGHFCSQFDKDEVEPLGLLKYDFLGLTTLRVLDKCLRLIEENHGLKIDIDALVPNDKDVFKMLNAGRVDGVFQFEGGGGRMGRDGRPPHNTMSGLLMNIGVDTFDDMIACVALFRPGTLKGMWDGKSVPETYCDYKHGVKPPKYLHPKMQELLADTQGLMVYQEQVMLMAREIALFTMAEADTFRKGIGKKDMALVESLKQKFIDGCKKNNVDDSVGSKVFELCQSFSGYGFNKAHAACYAFIGYQCAWLKLKYKKEFAAALMSTFIGNEIKLTRYERVYEKEGIHILPCQVNKSKLEYSIEPEGIRRPLSTLKGLGEKQAKVIVDSQPYSSLKDFVSKVGGQSVNKAVFETLVNSGCMDCLGMSRHTLISAYEEAKESAKNMKKEMEKERKKAENFGSLDLFGVPSAGL